MSEIAIELATIDDVPAILAISNGAAERTAANFATEPEPLEHWRASFEATHLMYPWLVARRGLTVAGFAKASPHRTRGAYRWTAEVSVYVDPSAARQGIGSALYEALVGTMRAQRYVTLLAGIALPNPASVRLHESFGFSRCGTYRRAGFKLGAWHDVGYWELALRTGDDAPRPLRDVRAVWTPLEIGDAPITSDAARGLIGRLNAELGALYPEPGATHFRLDPEETSPGRGAFLVARVDGEPAACGAIRKLEDGSAEVKRMFVDPRWRGRGLSTRVLTALERRARELGASRVVLETGVRQKEAIALYEGAGYARIPPFGEYLASPTTSVCFAKDLT